MLDCQSAFKTDPKAAPSMYFWPDPTFMMCHVGRLLIQSVLIPVMEAREDCNVKI